MQDDIKIKLFCFSLWFHVQNETDNNEKLLIEQKEGKHIWDFSSTTGSSSTIASNVSNVNLVIYNK